MTEPLRIGLLGAARITPKAVVKPAMDRDDVVLKAVAARDEEKARAFAAAHGVERHTTYDALIEADDVDLVYNALPVSEHAPMTIRALEAGKHVLCEKPFAMNLAEAESVLAAAKASDRRVVEAFHHRYHPAFETYLSWIADDRIGPVKKVRSVFTVPIPDKDGEIRYRPELGGGAMRDLGCYALAWAIAVFGEAPERVTARATTAPSGVDDAMRVELVFPSGGEAELNCDMRPETVRMAAIFAEGERGQAGFVNPVAPHQGAALSWHAQGEAGTAPIAEGTTYDHQLAALVDALRSGAPLPTEGQAILDQQRALDAAYQSAGLGALLNAGAA
ncbi:Gfo/Idh/MocA family protein [Parvularcula dongshanensis]|uniref:Putative dehydrogenase n=1 Tax=Parvularcula dongshanensis TaxID=1173995 RepID=A0A840I2D0_9PROT|nr:Gfo/Idh/MocA family oxidoreductase [Parvularcula dongshanensis]MBB4658348.1 putative dehydrogenase [Parvularcula dongshanensis]